MDTDPAQLLDGDPGVAQPPLKKQRLLSYADLKVNPYKEAGGYQVRDRMAAAEAPIDSGKAERLLFGQFKMMDIEVLKAQLREEFRIRSGDGWT
jgi:hypothetical protein